MKIFYIDNNPKGRGTYWRCFWLGRSLAKEGHQVTIFCLQNKKTLKISTQVIDKVKVISLPRFANYGLRELPGHLYRATYVFFKSITSSIDVFHTFNVASLTCGLPVPPLWFLKKIRLVKFKIVVDWDDLWGKEGLTHLNKQGIITENIADFLETKIPLLADKVTVASNELKKRALRSGVEPKNIIKIINGSAADVIKTARKNDARKKLNIPLNEKIVCFAGTITINLRMILASFELACKKLNNLRMFVLAPLKPEVELLIKGSKVSNKIHSLGILPYEDYLLHLAASDLILLPRSKHILDRCEFPSRLGDIMALGKPTLTNRSGDAWKLVIESKAGLVAKVEDDKDFAKEMIKILTDDNLARRLAKNARSAAEKKYSWDKLSEKLYGEVYSA